MKFFLLIEVKRPHKRAEIASQALSDQLQNAIKYYRIVYKTDPKCRKKLITQKWCEIGQKFVLTTNSKPWVWFPKLPLIRLSWQRGWATCYTALPEMQKRLILQCQVRLQISRVKTIARVFDLSGVAFRLIPSYCGLLVCPRTGSIMLRSSVNYPRLVKGALAMIALFSFGRVCQSIQLRMKNQYSAMQQA